MLSKLDKIVSISARLLLYIDYLDLLEIYCLSESTSVDVNTCIETRCSTTCDSISYLLSFKGGKEVDKINKSNHDKAYVIELQGKDDRIVNTSHMFILIYHDDWYLLDSYFNQRKFGYRRVDINLINKLLDQLKIKFSRDTWFLLTGDDKPGDCKTVEPLIFEYDYETDDRYSDLTKLAKDKLETEDGLSDEYLWLLSPSFNIDEAKDYLESL